MLVLKIILLLLLLILLAIILYALLVPLRIRVDTDDGAGQLTWGPVLRGELGWKGDDPEPWIDVRAAWWHRKWTATELLIQNRFTGKKLQEKGDQKQPQKKRFRPKVRRIRNLLASFRCREFLWELDTDDFIMDAFLFPVGFFLSQRGYDIRINFIGRNRLLFDIENTGARLLYHYFKPLKH